MEGSLTGGAVVAAAGGLAVDGDELCPVGPGLAHPGGKGGRKQRRADAVHQNGQPAPAGDAVCVGQVLAQEAQMRLTPVGNGFIVVAIGDRVAHHQQQHLTQWMQDAVDVAGIVDVGKVLQQGGQAGPTRRRLNHSGDGRHHRQLRIGELHRIKPNRRCHQGYRI